MIEQERKIIKILKSVEIPPHLVGYMYIKRAVLMVLEDETNLIHITKSIYPEIAKRYKTTVSRVERAIRNAVETAFWNMPEETAEQMFGNTSDAESGKVTNGHFIATLAEMIKLQED